MSEEQEQVLLVKYLELKGHKFSSIPNSTYTKSWSQKAKNTRTGLRPGLPDMFIILKNNVPLFIEMKKQKTGKVSESQKEWLEALKNANILAFVCYGFDEAKEVIDSLSSNVVTPYDSGEEF